MVRDSFYKVAKVIKSQGTGRSVFLNNNKFSQKGKSNHYSASTTIRATLIKISHLIKHLLAYSTSRSCIKEGEKLRCYEGKKEKERKREQIRMHAERISVPWLFCPAASRKKEKN